MESAPFHALHAIEESRFEMLRNAARALLEWNRPVEEIMAITGLSQSDVESLRGPQTDMDTAD